MSLTQKTSSMKPHMSLVVPGWVWEVGTVLTHGENKYSRGGWQKIPAVEYADALHRHVLLSSQDDRPDAETGLSHYSHIACNAMFLWWHEAGKQGLILDRRCKCSFCAAPAPATLEECAKISTAILHPAFIKGV